MHATDRGLCAKIFFDEIPRCTEIAMYRETVGERFSSPHNSDQQRTMDMNLILQQPAANRPTLSIVHSVMVPLFPALPTIELSAAMASAQARPLSSCFE